MQVSYSDSPNTSPNTTPPTTASSSPNRSPNQSQNGTSLRRSRALSLTNGRAVNASPPHSRPLSFLVPKSLFQSATAAAAAAVDLVSVEQSLSELSVSPAFQLEEPFLAILTKDQLLTMSLAELTQIFSSTKKVIDTNSPSASFVDLAKTKFPLIQQALCDRELIDKICYEDQEVWPPLNVACAAIIPPESLFRAISQCCTDQTRKTLNEFCQSWIRENSATLWLKQVHAAYPDFCVTTELSKPSPAEQAVLTSSNKINVQTTLTAICKGRIKPSTHAKEIANDLTAQQVSFYLRLSEHDLMPCKYQTPPTIFQEWKSHFNKLTDFVIDTILFTPCVSKGTEQLHRLASFFIEVGNHALSVGDFMTARAMLAALDNRNVLRLLSQELKASASYRLLDELSDQSLLRSKMAASSRHVPILALLEGDLTKLNEMQAVIVESDGRMHYNYNKLFQTHSLIKNFLAAQRTWQAQPTPTTTFVACYLAHKPKDDNLRELCSNTWKPPVIKATTDSFG